MFSLVVGIQNRDLPHGECAQRYWTTPMAWMLDATLAGKGVLWSL